MSLPRRRTRTSTVRGKRGRTLTDGLEAPGRSEGNAPGSVVGKRQRAAGPEERHGQTQHERPVGVSDLDFVFHIRLIDPPILLTSALSSRLLGYRTTTKDVARLALTKALKTGVYTTTHSAPQPPIGVDPVLEAEAVKLREAVARGALEAQLARAQEGGGVAG